MRRQTPTIQALVLGLLCGCLAGVVPALPLEKAPDVELPIVRESRPLTSLNLVSNKITTVLSWIERPSPLMAGTRVRSATIKDGRLSGPPVVRSVLEVNSGRISALDVSLNPITSLPIHVWVLEDNDGSRLELREGLAETVTLIRSGVLIETPVVSHDRDGEAWIAWVETDGISSRVFAAGRDASREWQVIALGNDGEGYDVLPQLQPTARGMRFWWYSIADGETRVRAGTMVDGLLRRAGEPTIPGPPNRWPMLYWPSGSRTEAPGAIWLEQQGDGEQYFDKDPRRAADEPKRLGAAEREVVAVAVSEDRQAAKAWVELEPAGQQPAIRIVVESDGQARHLLTPQHTPEEVAVSSSDNWHHVAWISPDAFEGVVTLHYARMR